MFQTSLVLAPAKNIQKEVSEYVEVVRGIVSELLHYVVIWLFCTSWVSYNGHISLSQEGNKNLQTLKLMSEGSPSIRAVLWTANRTTLGGALHIRVHMKSLLWF